MSGTPRALAPTCRPLRRRWRRAKAALAHAGLPLMFLLAGLLIAIGGWHATLWLADLSWWLAAPVAAVAALDAWWSLRLAWAFAMEPLE